MKQTAVVLSMVLKAIGAAMVIVALVSPEFSPEFKIASRIVRRRSAPRSKGITNWYWVKPRLP